MANQHLDTPWTQDRVEELKRLWAEGFSATQIADELGDGLTRCGVLGKVHRLGLARHKGSEFKPGPPRPRKPRRRAVFIAPAPKPEPPPPPPPTPEPRLRMRRLQLLQLQSHHCRWPIGDPHGHPFYFCGADRELGMPYCPHHMRKAFAKPRGG